MTAPARRKRCYVPEHEKLTVTQIIARDEEIRKARFWEDVIACVAWVVIFGGFFVYQIWKTVGEPVQ